MNAPIFRLSAQIAALLLIYSINYNGYILAEDTFHTFTDKKGQAIEAVPLFVTPDKTKLGIRRKDGREFEMSILALNLDDQQFIKKWMKNNSSNMDYRFDITFEKSFERTKYVPGPKGRYDLKFITENTKYDINIKNMTCATLIGAMVEYYVITEHSTFTQEYNDPDEKEPTEWFYPFDYWERKNQTGKIVEKPISLIYKKIPLKELPFSYSADITTDNIPIREIQKNLSRETRNKDSLFGLILRITDANGNELSLQRSSDHDFLKKSWQEISKMPSADSSGKRSTKRALRLREE